MHTNPLAMTLIFDTQIIYLFAYTDGTINLVPAIVIPTAIGIGYILPGVINLKLICKPVTFGIWAYSIYNTASINLIPIYSYSNINDFDTDTRPPSEEIRLERRNNFNMSKLKLVIFYFVIYLSKN